MEKNSDRGISNFRISGQSFKNENCQNSIASHDIDMKLGPVTKLDKTNMAISKKKKKKKKLTMTPFRQIVISLYFFCFMASLQSSGSLIPNAWSHTIALSKVAISVKNSKFL